MKYIIPAVIALLAGYAAGTLRARRVITRQRTTIRRLRAGISAEEKKTETMKKVVWACLINGLLWIWCSYALAAAGRDQIAETLSSHAVVEIVGVVLAYAGKSLVENLSKNNSWPDRKPAAAPEASVSGPEAARQEPPDVGL